MFNPVLVLAAFVCCLLTSAATAAEVTYGSGKLTVKAENEQLGTVLLKITEKLGGKVVGPAKIFQQKLSFSGSGTPQKVFWRLLRNHASYGVNWSDDGSHIKVIQLLGEGDLVTLENRPGHGFKSKGNAIVKSGGFVAESATEGNVGIESAVVSENVVTGPEDRLMDSDASSVEGVEIVGRAGVAARNNAEIAEVGSPEEVKKSLNQGR